MQAAEATASAAVGLQEDVQLMYGDLCLLVQAGPHGADQNLVRDAEQQLLALPREIDEAEFFQQAARCALESLFQE